ncbi:GntR family transcriptional regulator [Corynebacterium terpenotabidum Y-11]|uniref:GntR family transcriptional regulator n=1 Tax=Corynebacterium terpenotabidum Y-11 TaxID=1200352 RepID=S4XJH5_9CORY|nr:GntR family transcriptional regulator [Corynebacterium terpenotabidum Y-11]
MLASELRTWIRGRTPGTRLPSTRTLVRDHGVGPGTVQEALRILTAEGIVETRPGIGTFVAAAPEARRVRPVDHAWQLGALGEAPAGGVTSDVLRPTPVDAVALHNGFPDRDLLPEKAVRQALTRAARSEAAVTTAPRAGLQELRGWFAQELAMQTPADVTPVSATDVIVLPGTQAGLAGVFRAVVAPGEPVILESPTYWGAVLAARQTGVRLTPLPSGPTGPDPVELDRVFTRTGARLFYAQPHFANPTGALWSPELRERIMEVVRRHGAFLVEDDWAHDFTMRDADLGDPAPPLAAGDDSGRVIHLRSLTKSVSPALRVGAVVARGPVRERILGNVGATAMYVSPLLQAAALDVLGTPAWRAHRRTLPARLRHRRDLLVSAVRAHLPEADLAQVPAGGLNLWLQLPDATDLPRLVADCEARGVMIANGDGLFPAEPTGRFLRLNFAGPDPGRFDAAVAVIGDRLRHQGRQA